MNRDPKESKHLDSLTAYFAQFVASATFSDIPDDVLQHGKRSILDCLAVALSGSVTSGSRLIRQYLKQLGCPKGSSTVIGTSLELPSRFAALANGTSMHADDFDDTWEAATPHYQGGHPTAPVLAAVLAVAEQEKRTGEEVLAAYHVGVETACRLIDGSDVPGRAHGGRHATGTCGLLAAAAGICNLRKMSPEATRQVFGLAAGQAAGLIQNFGTMTKSFQVGHAAENGVVAADLVSMGFTASAIVLEGPGGFFATESSGWARERIEGRLGQPWAFTDRGIRLKPWPTGSLTHPGMTKILELIEKHDVQPDHVAGVRIKTSESTFRTLLPILVHHRPKTGLEAKLSNEFFYAALFVERHLDLTHYTDEFVNRLEVQRIIQLVESEYFSDAEAAAAGYTPLTTFVTIDLKDGQTLSGRVDDGKGSLANQMNDEEVAAKFRECANFAGWPKGKTEAAVDTVRQLQDVPNVRKLMAQLREDI